MSASKFLASVAFAALSATAQAQTVECPPPESRAPSNTVTDKAVEIGANVLGNMLGGAIRDAGRGLSKQAGQAVRDASGSLSRHTGEAQRQARNSVNQVSREAEKAARNGTRNGAETVKGAFQDCAPEAPPAQQAPAYQAPQPAAPAVGNALNSLLRMTR